MFVHKLFIVFILFVQMSDETRMKMRVDTFEPCDIPPSKMDPDEPVANPLPTLKKISNDVSVFSTNVTVKAFGPILISLRTYQLLGNERNLIFKLDKLTCKNPMTLKIYRTFGVKITKECMIPAGNYHFENVNIDSYGWILTKSLMNPGKYSYELEFASPKGVVSCTNIIVDAFLPQKKTT